MPDVKARLIRKYYGFTAVSDEGNTNEGSDGWNHLLLDQTGETIGSFETLAALIREAKRRAGDGPEEAAPEPAAETLPEPAKPQKKSKAGK